MPAPLLHRDLSLEKLLVQFEEDKDSSRLLSERTDAVDDLVCEASSQYLPVASVPLAVCAVGGYGRRELFPYGDVDLLIAVETEEQVHSLSEPISEFLRVLWDSGLRVSQSVRTIAECGKLQEENVELHISLLDLRFLAGNQSLHQKLEAKLTETFDRFRPAMVRRLVQLSRARHAKFNNTVYHLEPNVKETCGGLRDLHLLRWLSQLLPQREVLAEVLAELAGAAQFLFTQRCFLHSRAHRDANLLTFELQDASAHLLPPSAMPPETWMRLYFGHARSIFQAAERALEYAESQAPASLVSQLRNRQGRLSTPEFTVAHDRILLRNAAETLRSPENALHLFTFAGRHGLSLSWDSVRRVRAALPSLTEGFRSAPPSWTVWRELLAQPHTALALDDMNKCGFLSAAIPEWKSIDSLVVRDFYHRYTVDEHTLVAIRSIDDLANGAKHAPPRLIQLAREESQLPLLRLALLLHDLGKGTTPGEHVRGSLQAALIITNRLQVPGPSQEVVSFLISHHLDLSLIMNGRDLEDPATARALTESIETQEDLRRLVLLTYADITAVNPTAMTPWRLEQLWRVYLLGTEQLTRELASERLHIQTSSSWTPEQARFLEGLPKRYLRTHSQEQILHHLDLEATSRREGVAVDLRAEPGVWLITVIAQDKAGLFASLCGVLASFGMNIIKGEASSNASGTALDLIRFSDPSKTLELNPEELNRLSWTVQCVVRGSVKVEDLLKRRRPVRRSAGESTVVPMVNFNNDASDAATLIDFTAEDRPGLLYDLASAISSNDCNLEVVMIDTEAHRAIDVFYVTRNGRKLDEKVQRKLEVDLLKAAVRNPASDALA